MENLTSLKSNLNDNKIIVLFKEVGKDATFIKIENTLKTKVSTSLTKEQCINLIKSLPEKSYKYETDEEGNKVLKGNKAPKKPRFKYKVKWDDVFNSKPMDKAKVILNTHADCIEMTNIELLKKIKKLFTEVQNKSELSNDEKIEKMNYLLDKVNDSLNKTKLKNEKLKKEIPVFDVNEVLKMILSIQNNITKFISENLEE